MYVLFLCMCVCVIIFSLDVQFLNYSNKNTEDSELPQWEHLSESGSSLLEVLTKIEQSSSCKICTVTI